MLRYGSKEAAFYRGAGKPARLYKGTQLIAGWALSGKAVPCAWDATYNDTVSLDALGTAQQKSYSGKNLFNADAVTTAVTNSGAEIAQNRFQKVDDVIGVKDSMYGVGVYYLNSGMQLTKGTRISISFDAMIGNADSDEGGAPNGAVSISLRVLGSSVQYVNYSIPASIGSFSRITVSIGVPETGLNYLALQPVGTASAYTFWAYFKNIQVESASAATEYEPYVGGQPSPNPDYPQELTASQATLTGSDRTGGQTESLRLPVLRQVIGTEVRDELHGKTLTRRVGVIELYSGEDVGAVWCSTTGQLTTGATVWYQLAEPVTQELDAELKTYIGYTALDVEGTLLPEITATAKVAI